MCVMTSEHKLCESNFSSSIGIQVQEIGCHFLSSCLWPQQIRYCIIFHIFNFFFLDAVPNVPSKYTIQYLSHYFPEQGLSE